VVRQIDPAVTCGTANCAITKALDLTCATQPKSPSLSVTAAGAVVMFKTDFSDTVESSILLPRLMTLDAAGARVQDVSTLALPFGSTIHIASSTTSSGAKWLFAVGTTAIVAEQGTEAGWTSSTVESSSSSEYGAVLTNARMVDDSLGYLTYHDQGILEPRLVTWDGSCWTDQIIGEPRLLSIAVETDAEKLPWVAWHPMNADSGVRLLHLRSPRADTQRLEVTSDPPLSGAPLRLLPGGLDGKAAAPAVAARFGDGIRVLSSPATTDSAWTSLLLPESASASSGTGNCPSDQPSSSYVLPCSGLTSCSQQLSGVAGRPSSWSFASPHRNRSSPAFILS
jgi:hypothetical protein